MSSPTRIHIGADETGLLGMKQTPEAAAKVTALLQEDMEVRHVHCVTASLACANPQTVEAQCILQRKGIS